MAGQAITRIQATNILTSGVGNTVSMAFQQSWTEPLYWDPLSHCHVAQATNTLEHEPIPMPPSLPVQVYPGTPKRMEPVAIADIQVLIKRYETWVSIDQFKAKNPAIREYSDQVVQALGNYREQHIAQQIGALLATNPTLKYYDNATMFSSSHPINPFRTNFKNPQTASTTQSNLFTSSGFNMSNLDTTINKIMNWALPNGRPLNPRGFVVYLPLGNSIPKAAHIVHGAMQGMNLAMNGTADVGANSNMFEEVKMVVKGFQITIVPLPDYQGTQTDWFVAPIKEQLKPFLFKEMEPHRLVSFNQDTWPSVAMYQEEMHRLDAEFGLAYTIPLALAKCTA
jgi:hypothetical protein